jgi:putative Mg2+ transporter-C (MgtC) family protein
MISPEETILRVAVAAILGGLVGLERERLEWAAGMRTHALVSLGSAQWIRL